MKMMPKQKQRLSFHHSLHASDALLRFSSLFRRSALDIFFTILTLMLFSVYEKRMKKSDLLMNALCVSFVFTTQIECSECCV